MYLQPSFCQGLVAFGQDVLKATALNQAIKDMHAAKKYLSLRLIMLLISNHNNYCNEITMQCIYYLGQYCCELMSMVAQSLH